MATLEEQALQLIMGFTLPDGRRLEDAIASDRWLLDDIIKPLISRDADDRPLHGFAWLEASRGSAKSTAVSFVVLAMALLEPGLLVGWCARDVQQAELLSDSLTGVLRRTPALAGAFNATGRGEWKLRNGSVLRVLSSDVGSAFGLGPGFRRLVVVADELTVWLDRSLYDALSSTTVKLPGSQVIVLCNAGRIGSWQHELRGALVDVGAYVWAPPGPSPASWIDQRALEVTRHTLPPATFRRLHLNEWSIGSEEQVIKEGWLRFYDVAPAEPRAVVQSWDTAYEAKRTADYSVGLTFAVGDDGYYLLDMVRDRLEFPELRRTMEAQVSRHWPQAIVIEDAASGRSLRQELQRTTRLPIVGRRPVGDKVARAFAISAIVEAGRLYLPRGAAWLPDFIGEVCGFPAAVHDDVMDALTQGLSYLSGVYGFDRPAGAGTSPIVAAGMSRAAGLRPATLGGQRPSRMASMPSPGRRPKLSEDDAEQADTVIRFGGV